MNNENVNNIKRKYANTFRLNFAKGEKEDILQIDFGEFITEEGVEPKNVDIKASIDLPIKLIKELILRNILLAQAYQEVTGKDLGIPNSKSKTKQKKRD